MIEIKSNSYKKTEQIGETFAKLLLGKEFIALFGDLGAGKTAFTRGICRGLNVTNNVCSPTFAILNEYQGKYKIFHFDMYRIKSIEDLYSTGYFDYFNEGIFIIEWSENILNFLPKNAIKITIKYGKGENDRVFTFEGTDLDENFSN